ncbi:MAG: DUF1566 domain-containing protein [Cytophagales bacterium]|nr:DUF1566 domain-containing protein [Cytophagales bacterium]
MKKLTITFVTTLICIIFLNLCLPRFLGGNLCFAQAPQSFKYQAVARDISGNILANQAVGFQISILKTTATGIAVYIETHTDTTNQFGLVNLEIGKGTVTTGDFTTIDWANDDYFIQVKMDATGGATYAMMGTSQLLSVPYALHAKTAEIVTETDPVFGSSVAGGITVADTANWNAHTVDTDTHLDSTGVAALGFVAGAHVDSTAIANMGFIAGGASSSFYLGQDTLGGIIYNLYIGSDGLQHGLIVNKTESTAVWQATGTTTNAIRSWDGVFNTDSMTSSAAATYVNGLTSGGFTDWYLPSIDELSLLWHNRFYANKALNTGGFTLLSNTANYWSSTEFNTTNAIHFGFFNGNATLNSKTSTLSVRAVRAF